MDSKDSSLACYWLAFSWRIFLLSVPQHPYCILIMMHIMEKHYRYRPSHSFCFLWMVFTCLCSCSQAPSLPFLCPFSYIFPALLFHFLSKSVEFRPMIAMAFPEFLVLIGWSVQKVSDNRKTFTEKCYWILHSFLTQLHRTWLFPGSPFWAWVEAEDFQHLFKMSGPLTAHVANPNAPTGLYKLALQQMRRDFSMPETCYIYRVWTNSLQMCKKSGGL